jgi:hypothetical protein
MPTGIVLYQPGDFCRPARLLNHQFAKAHQMGTAYRLYLVGRGLGVVSECVQMLGEVEQAVDAMNNPRHRVNLWARVLENQEEAADELLDENQVAHLTGGVFPVLFFNATYDVEAVGAEEFQQLESQFELLLLKHGRSRHNSPF